MSTLNSRLQWSLAAFVAVIMEAGIGGTAGYSCQSALKFIYWYGIMSMKEG
jgi:hypothetical protein